MSRHRCQQTSGMLGTQGPYPRGGARGRRGACGATHALPYALACGVPCGATDVLSRAVLAAMPGQKAASNMPDQWNCGTMPLSLPV